MLFLSQFIKVPIVDSADITAGNCVDFIARRSTEDKYPHIIGIVYKDRRTKELKNVSFDSIENLGGDEITLKTVIKKIQPFVILENDLWLAQHILDKQIVDLDGTRVVRVNDIRFGLSDNKLHVLGVDISTRGIIRRLGLGKLRIFSLLKPAFIEWDKMQIVGKSLKLTNVTQELVKLHPADLANVLETLNPSHSGELVQSLDPITVAKVFQELKPEFKRDIFRRFTQKQIEVVMSHVPVDELVDYLKTINRKDRDKIIDHLSTAKKKEVEEFLHYPDDTAGGIMSTEFVRENVEITVAEALQNVRKLSHTYRSINYIYIVDKKDHFLGVVSLRTLISSKPTDKVGKIMKRIKAHQTVHPDATIQHVATLMTRYNLLSLAVLEKDSTLLGVVMVDDLMRQLLPHA